MPVTDALREDPDYGKTFTEGVEMFSDRCGNCNHTRAQHLAELEGVLKYDVISISKILDCDITDCDCRRFQ